MKNSKLLLAAAIIWLITSFVLLTLPGSAFPQENWLDKIWADKWIHIGMFSIMVVLWCLAWRAIKRESSSVSLKRAFIIIAIVFLAYGIAMEFVQLYFVVNRSFDTSDILADAVGCGVGLSFSLGRYIKK